MGWLAKRTSNGAGETQKQTRDRLAALAKAVKAGASNADGTYAGPAAKAHVKLRPKRAAQRPEGAGVRASLGALAIGDFPGMDLDRLSFPGAIFADTSSFEDAWKDKFDSKIFLYTVAKSKIF